MKVMSAKEPSRRLQVTQAHCEVIKGSGERGSMRVDGLPRNQCPNSHFPQIPGRLLERLLSSCHLCVIVRGSILANALPFGCCEKARFQGRLPVRRML